jgi:hypothetical protein
MKKRWFYLLSFALVAPAAITAQSARAFEKAGDKAWSGKDYYAASVHYRNALEASPGDAGLLYKYAEAARQFNAYETAETYYLKVLEDEKAGEFPLANFWLGQVQKTLGKYQEAAAQFEAYTQLDGDPYYRDWASKEITACQRASNPLPSATHKITVEHLDKKINSPYSEFGAIELGQTLYFSSYRFDFPKDSHKPRRKLSKIMTSDKSAKGKLLPKGFNEEEKLTAHTAFSNDKSRIYFTVCQYVTSSEIRCEIFYREKDKRGAWEKKAVKLPDFINLSGSTATHPAIGFEPAAQKEVLYFVSDRPGGKGKLDIWSSVIDKGQFSAPVNLAAVNTPENDVTPFYHSPTGWLYFSSDGEAGWGGYDVYRFKAPDLVENVGFEVNSSYHDLYYTLNEDGSLAYLSSNRPGAFYLDAENRACCHDIYRVRYEPLLPPTQDRPQPAPIEPVVPQPEQPTTPQTLEDFLPLSLYFDNDEPDKRSTRTSTKKNYPETFGKYYDRRREYVENYTRSLQEEEASEAALEIEDFFENDVRKGHAYLNLFSDILLSRLASQDTVEIVIKGYTSPRAASDYNDRLAQRRISSLRNHFDTYKDGVFQPYLKQGKLILSEAPFGETKAAAAVSDRLEDERNSIYSAAAARERRVEIVEVK